MYQKSNLPVNSCKNQSPAKYRGTPYPIWAWPEQAAPSSRSRKAWGWQWSEIIQYLLGLERTPWYSRHSELNIIKDLPTYQTNLFSKNVLCIMPARAGLCWTHLEVIIIRPFHEFRNLVIHTTCFDISCPSAKVAFSHDDGRYQGRDTVKYWTGYRKHRGSGRKDWKLRETQCRWGGITVVDGWCAVRHPISTNNNSFLCMVCLLTNFLYLM